MKKTDNQLLKDLQTKTMELTEKEFNKKEKFFIDELLNLKLSKNDFSRVLPIFRNLLNHYHQKIFLSNFHYFSSLYYKEKLYEANPPRYNDFILAEYGIFEAALELYDNNAKDSNGKKLNYTKCLWQALTTVPFEVKMIQESLGKLFGEDFGTATFYESPVVKKYTADGFDGLAFDDLRIKFQQWRSKNGYSKTNKKK